MERSMRLRTMIIVWAFIGTNGEWSRKIMSEIPVKEYKDETSIEELEEFFAESLK